MYLRKRICLRRNIVRQIFHSSNSTVTLTFLIFIVPDNPSAIMKCLLVIFVALFAVAQSVTLYDVVAEEWGSFKVCVITINHNIIIITIIL